MMYCGARHPDVVQMNMPIDEGLARALRVAGNAHRLDILQELGSAAACPDALAGKLGLSRRTVERHLTALEDCGLLSRLASSNGPLFALDREAVALLNARFFSVMGRAASAVPVDHPHATDEALPVVPESPEGCRQCQNASFVRSVLDDLDRTLLKAREYQARLRQMSSSVLAAQEEERKRIARELHDDTAQALTAVLVRLALLARAAPGEAERAALTELRDLTAEAVEGLRRLAVDLRPPMLDDLGLEAALRAHAEDFAQRWQIDARLTCDGSHRLPPTVELVLYRVVQEALSNVAKHARASRVDVTLRRRGNLLRLAVTDNGCGFDRYAANGRDTALGLFGMEERLALVGGTLRVDSVPGRGTRVSAAVPLVHHDSHG